MQMFHLGRRSKSPACPSKRDDDVASSSSSKFRPDVAEVAYLRMLHMTPGPGSSPVEQWKVARDQEQDPFVLRDAMSVSHPEGQ